MGKNNSHYSRDIEGTADEWLDRVTREVEEISRKARSDYDAFLREQRQHLNEELTRSGRFKGVKRG